MFTGIVRAVGQITAVESLPHDGPAGVRLTIDAGEFDLSAVGIGDSIAIQGACMTVIALDAPYFQVEVSQESLACTAGLDRKGPVNLEGSMRLGATLDGHIVLGHVDGVGTIRQFEPVGESYLLKVLAPEACARYLAFKGSVTINGVSLTVNSVVDQPEGCEISINLIPHTVAATTFQYAQPGQQVNIEVDMMARYVERLLQKIQFS